MDHKASNHSHLLRNKNPIWRLHFDLFCVIFECSNLAPGTIIKKRRNILFVYQKRQKRLSDELWHWMRIAWQIAPYTIWHLEDTGHSNGGTERHNSGRRKWQLTVRRQSAVTLERNAATEAIQNYIAMHVTAWQEWNQTRYAHTSFTPDIQTRAGFGREAGIVCRVRRQPEDRITWPTVKETSYLGRDVLQQPTNVAWWYKKHLSHQEPLERPSAYGSKNWMRAETVKNDRNRFRWMCVTSRTITELLGGSRPVPAGSRISNQVQGNENSLGLPAWQFRQVMVRSQKPPLLALKTAPVGPYSDIV